MMVPEVGGLNLQIAVAEEHGRREVYTYTYLIMPYYNVARLNMSSYYLTRGRTQMLHAAGFYSATE